MVDHGNITALVPFASAESVGGQVGVPVFLIHLHKIERTSLFDGDRSFGDQYVENDTGVEALAHFTRLDLLPAQSIE